MVHRRLVGARLSMFPQGADGFNIMGKNV